jgi:CobW/HypB/UreG, nucleotide-binding domain
MGEECGADLRKGVTNDEDLYRTHRPVVHRAYCLADRRSRSRGEHGDGIVGESVVILGVTATGLLTEGEDKPLKYPSIFFKSELLILNKIDLLPYVPFDVATAEENSRRVHCDMDIVRVSCQTP